ncbi:MAG: FecR domain-containing protein [Pedobacter sp.]|uniref:FecR family protein n=1 Tax=Pedobacter sp. TaxID=1411316 RepID=UPI00356A56E1
MEDVNKIFNRYINNEASPEEVKLLLQEFLSEDRNAELSRLIDVELQNDQSNEYSVPELNDLVTRNRLKLKDQLQPKQNRPFRWLSAAAAIFILALGFAAYMTLQKFESPRDRNVAQADIYPAKGKAFLTLSNGQRIDLDSAETGIIINDSIIQYNNGKTIVSESAYDQKDTKNAGTSLNTSYVTLTTPKGGTYQVTLSDGTQVWLNAASTLKYPYQFKGDSRNVELEGEAYFSVTKSKIGTSKVQFAVKSKGQIVRVFGTEFNISAYLDEADVKTTLVNGIVRVGQEKGTSGSTDSDFKELLPGQQSVNTNGSIKIRQVDVSGDIAWKDGLFYFNDTPLKDALDQVSRWYDLNIIYKGAIPKETFTGEISRKVPLRVVLNFLKNAGIPYQINGRELTINN